MASTVINESETIESRISYINSTHGKQQLLFNGARFCIKQKNKNSILWRCIKTNCSASITVSKEGNIVRINEMHNHLIEPNEIIFLELRHKLKKEAQTTSTPIDKIVELAYSEMIVEENITDSVVKFPTIKTLKNTVNKQRRRSRPAIPKSIANIPHPIPILYRLTKQNSDFLLYDGQLGENRALVFASIEDVRYLANQKYWYADGTFYTSPSMFYQIYSIHVFDEGLSTPCIFALLADKQESTYNALFRKLFEKMRELCQTIQLQSITIDYELAVKNVVTKNLPHVTVKGCLFHYGQSLFRKFVDLHLKTSFQNDESLRIWFRSFAAISLLPYAQMNGAYEYLHSIKPVLYRHELDLFMEYHNKNYGINSHFPPSMYNHYRNINPRTINYLEGRHNRWKKRSTKAHADIYTCIDMFKSEQLLAADARRRHEAGTSPPRKRKNIRIAEDSLNRLWDKLEKQQINQETFLKGAGLRYFQYIEIE